MQELKKEIEEESNALQNPNDFIGRHAKLCDLKKRPELNGLRVFVRQADPKNPARVIVNQQGCPEVKSFAMANLALDPDEKPDYLVQAQQRYALAKTFALYDFDRSGDIDKEEFTSLVRDLLTIQHGVVPDNQTLTTEVTRIAGCPTFPRVGMTIDFENFLNFVLEHNAFGQQLKEVLLSSTDTLVNYVTARQEDTAAAASAATAAAAAAPIAPPAAEPAEWEPTYEYSNYTEPLAWTGLDVRMSTGEARIPDPMQLQLPVYLPSGEMRRARPLVRRYDTLREALEKVVEHMGIWTERFAQGADLVFQLNDGTLLDPNQTVDEARLYFLNSGRQVRVVERR
jgi:hypothetical protein